METPSAHQIGDKVKLNFGTAGTLNNCQIVCVQFTEGKVFYDISVEIKLNGERTQIQCVDSSFVEKAD